MRQSALHCAVCRSIVIFADSNGLVGADGEITPVGCWRALSAGCLYNQVGAIASTSGRGHGCDDSMLSGCFLAWNKAVVVVLAVVGPKIAGYHTATAAANSDSEEAGVRSSKASRQAGRQANRGGERQQTEQERDGRAKPCEQTKGSLVTAVAY